MADTNSYPADLDAIRANVAEVEQRWADPEEDLYGLLAAAGRLMEDCKALLVAADRTAPVMQTALALRDADSDDDISQAWADFDQAVDDYRAADHA